MIEHLDAEGSTFLKTITITDDEAIAKLRASIEDMSDYDVCLLVLVASHALNDTAVTSMIADEIGVSAECLSGWFDTTISPVEDPNGGSWALAQQATGPVALQSESDLLEFLLADPQRIVLLTGEDQCYATVQVEGSHCHLARVPPNSAAAELIELTIDAGGNGSIEGGDPELWARLPIRCGRWCGSLVLPTHPQAHQSFPKARLSGRTDWSEA